MSEATDELVIEVKGLVAHYGKRKILDGIDFDVRADEIMVIMGGSGSGKSTLVRQLLSLDRPTSGTIHVLGKEIAKLGTVERGEFYKDIGVAFQSGALFSSMSVGENIMLPLTEHTKLDEQTQEKLQKRNAKRNSMMHRLF